MSTTYVGGDIVEVTCNHPSLGNFNFGTKSNESYKMEPGGRRSNDDANSISGDGKMIDQINNVRWSFEGPLMADFVTGNDMNNLNKLAESPELGTWTIEHLSGAVWRGRGKFVGNIEVDTNTAQITGKLAGGGKLEPLN